MVCRSNFALESFCRIMLKSRSNNKQDMTGLRRSTFGLKSKLANLPMVNDTDIDHASTGQSKITGRKRSEEHTSELQSP